MSYKIIYTDKSGKQKIAKYKCSENEAIAKVQKRKDFSQIKNVVEVIVLIPTKQIVNVGFVKVDEDTSDFYL